MVAAELRFVHISDLHIRGDSAEEHGVDTAAVLSRAVLMINRLRPNFVIATGDLVSDGSLGSYRQLRTLLAPLAAPIHFAMGSRDSRADFRRVFDMTAAPTDEPIFSAFEEGGVGFLLLDSTLPGKDEGWLSPEQLAWLDAELAAHPARPTWIFLHHQPLPIYIRWLDRSTLQEPDGLLTILSRHPQVRAVAYGHVHQSRVWRYGKALFLGVPALAFQYSSVHQEETITQEPPGFRLVEIVGGELRHSLHYLDGQIVPEARLAALPVYVR